MTPPDKTSEKVRLPLILRFLLSLFGIAAAFVFTVFMGYMLAVQDVFSHVILASLVVLAITLPHMRYKTEEKILAIIAILVTVAVVLGAAALFLSKPYRLHVADKYVPTYPHAELKDVSYSHGDADTFSTVRYTYAHANAEQEFPKVKKYYEEHLDFKRWRKVSNAIGIPEVSEKALDTVYFAGQDSFEPWVMVSMQAGNIVVDAQFH